MALLPPYLQNLMNYPVITTGMLLAPRGVGTLVAMVLVGRILARGIDPRMPAAIGISLTALSMWMITGWNADVPVWPIINAGVVQGLGLGLVFVPVSTMAYATPADGHAHRSRRHLQPGAQHRFQRRHLDRVYAGGALHPDQPCRDRQPRVGLQRQSATRRACTPLQGLAMLNGEITRQAAAIGYINDFWLMTWLTLATLPLLLLFRVPGKSNNASKNWPRTRPNRNRRCCRIIRRQPNRLLLALVVLERARRGTEIAVGLGRHPDKGRIHRNVLRQLVGLDLVQGVVGGMVPVEIVGPVLAE